MKKPYNKMFQVYIFITCWRFSVAIRYITSSLQSDFQMYVCQFVPCLQDSRLELTGPGRTVLLRSEYPHGDPFENSCIMEIDLKVRGIGTPPSEDKILCQNAII
jgi:hypothetical protein